MGNIFAITTTTNDIKADAAGKASAIFTVTNTSNKPIRGIARSKALGSTQQDWLDVKGETEMDFGAGGTQQFTVNFKATGAPAGKFPFRLDVASATNSDEEFTEGPTVNVETAATPAPAVKKGSSLWIVIIVIVGLALLVLAGILFLVLRGDKTPAVNANTNTAATPKKTPAVESTPALKSVTDGARYRDERDNAIYLAVDGKLRHVLSEAIMNNLFKDWSVVSIPNAEEFPIGSPLADGTYLAKTPSAPEIYLVVEGQKRWIPSQVVFDRYNFNGNRVQMLSAEQMAIISTGPNIP
jgi:hypothetical protein